MEDDFINNVNDLYRNNRWSDIVELDVRADDTVAHCLLWVWPSVDNLRFIETATKLFNKQSIISIGCGSGLLEWLVHSGTGIPVTGVEIEKSWWCSKYAKHKYIPLVFAQMPPASDMLPAHSALLFCYFNSGPAFSQYIDAYHGDLVFIVGPGKKRGTLANPEPFDPGLSAEWQLWDSQEVKRTGDFIAVWKRNTPKCCLPSPKPE